MKCLLFLSILLLLFVKANTQSDRWMYVGVTDENTLTIDTVKDDVKQLRYYSGHSNVVLIWVKMESKKPNKERANNDYTVTRFAIDTTISQIKMMSSVSYQDKPPPQSKTFELSSWDDVIPGSAADIMLHYCRVLNNKRLMANFIVEGLLNNNSTSSPIK